MVSIREINALKFRQVELNTVIRLSRKEVESKRKEPPGGGLDAVDGPNVPTFSHRFKSLKAAREYAKFGTSDECQTFPSYECVVTRTRPDHTVLRCRQCGPGPNGVQRRLEGNLVTEFGAHHHDINASPTKHRRRFTPDEKAFLRSKVITDLPSAVWQMGRAAGFDFTLNEIRNQAKNIWRKSPDHTLEQWIKSNQATWNEMGMIVEFAGDSAGWAVCISSRELIDAELLPDDVATFDGNPKHNKMTPNSGRGTTIMLGPFFFYS
jgi:hypothetical protein